MNATFGFFMTRQRLSLAKAAGIRVPMEYIEIIRLVESVVPRVFMQPHKHFILSLCLKHNNVTNKV